MSADRPTTASRDHSGALLLTVHATLLKYEVTTLGHLSCLLEANGQLYRALGDPIVANLVELRLGATLRAVLLRMRGAGPDAPWQWHLLCCRADVAAPDVTVLLEQL